MKKGDHLFLVQVAEESKRYNAFTRKRAVLDYIKQHKNAALAPSGRIITVQMVGEWEVEQVALLVPKVEDEELEPKPGFRGNDGRIPCIDIRCLDGGGHFKDECPHKDESTPCEDKACPVKGPHTIYNCHQVPRSQMICSDAGFCNVEGCYHKTAHEFIDKSCDSKGHCHGAPTRTEVCKPV